MSDTLEPFEGPRGLVENASYHISRVETLFDRYRNDHPLKLVQRSIGNGQMSYTYQPSAKLPVSILAATKDAIHNCRSSLDIMAVEVVRLNGRGVSDVLFPFAQNEDDLEQAIKNRNFHKASQEAQNLMRDLKPFAAGNAMLRALHDMDVAGKHKFVVPATQKTMFEDVKIGGIQLKNVSMTGIDHQFVAPIGTPFSMKTVRADLIFGNKTALSGKDVIPHLHGFREMTAGIIEAFAALFGR